MTLKEAYKKLSDIGKADMKKDDVQKYKDLFGTSCVPKLITGLKFKTDQHVEQLSMQGEIYK